MTERYATATIKRSGKDEPWIVFHGRPNEIKADIGEAFGIEAGADLTLRDVVLNAQSAMNSKAVLTAMNALGGTIVKSESTPEKHEDASQAAQQTAPATEGDGSTAALFEAIANAPTVDALKALWAENQAAFADPEVMAAWKAAGKALKSA